MVARQCPAQAYRSGDAAAGIGSHLRDAPTTAQAPKYCYDALTVLRRVWAASGGQCGKYLAASMRLQFDGLQRHDELAFGRDRYSPAVRGELLEMSAASIDRYLAPAKAKDQISGVSTTKPSPLLRNSIKVRRAGDEVEDELGFFNGDTVAQCGPTLTGEFARTLNPTDVHVGWVFTRTVRNANTHILGALRAAVHEIPYEVPGLDFGNGTKFLNKAVIKWAAEMEIFFTRSRPYKKRDQATQESGLCAYRDRLNPAAIARQIADLQTALLRLAKDETEQLYLAAIPAALPDVRSGIRTKNRTAS